MRNDVSPPAEFVGLARQFMGRTQRTADERQRFMDRWDGRIKRRLKIASLRNEMLAEYARDLRLAGCAVDYQSSEHRLVAVEYFLIPARAAMHSWNDWPQTSVRTPDNFTPYNSEITVDVFVTLTLAKPKRVEAESVLLATANLHAIARRYMRGFSVTDAAIQADLFALARSYKALLCAIVARNDLNFTFPCPDGAWRGHAVRIAGCNNKEALALDARTFV